MVYWLDSRQFWVMQHKACAVHWDSHGCPPVVYPLPNGLLTLKCLGPAPHIFRAAQGVAPSVAGSLAGLNSALSFQSPFRLFSATSNKWPKIGGVVEVPFLLSRKYGE